MAFSSGLSNSFRDIIKLNKSRVVVNVNAVPRWGEGAVPGCPCCLHCPCWMLSLVPDVILCPDPFSVCRWCWVWRATWAPSPHLRPQHHPCHPWHIILIPTFTGAARLFSRPPTGAPLTAPSPVLPPHRRSHPLLGFVSPAGDPAAEEWSQWSVCSLTCGQGSQVRTRSCVSSPYGTLCSGLLRETRTCNNTATCPGMGGGGGTWALGGASLPIWGDAHRWLGSGVMPKGLRGWVAGESGDLCCWGGFWSWGGGLL